MIYFISILEIAISDSGGVGGVGGVGPGGDGVTTFDNKNIVTPPTIATGRTFSATSFHSTIIYLNFF